jgi:carboxylesterase
MPPTIHAPAFNLLQGRIGVLLIHGFTASPTEMRPLGDFLYQQGFSVSGVRLAGHGTSPEDLLSTSWTDWLESAVKAYHELCSQCDRVFIAGLSMGAVLAVHLAFTHRPSPTALFLMAPALYPRSPFLGLSPYLSFIIPRLGKGPKSQAYFAKHGLYSYSHMPTRSLGHLFRLLQKTRPLLAQLELPIHIFMGRLDRTVAVESGLQLFNQINSQIKTLTLLPNSRHILTVEADACPMFIRINQLIDQHKKVG